uniref:pollen receptor-like kinase 4 n=1 Tax=Erigeron canadensis TaxID=72917 RepID=UPI001CB948FA|nr:pollen receptor-like kinase 4 [Erigeron canadensis]
MTVARAHLNVYHLLHVILLMLIMQHANSADNDTLLELKQSLKNGDKLITWNPLTTPCNGNKPNWEGVLCANNTVWGIRLEGKGLGGFIDTKILMNLPSLLTISFQNNSLEGEFPSFKKLHRLRSIFLTSNKFSKEIPTDAFDGMRRLKKLYLANNYFEGQIPSSLTGLPRLRDLMLENNRFEGVIPVFMKDNLTIINFANNNLYGPIPKRLQSFPKSQFSGNGELCGPPFAECKTKIPTATIVMVALVVVAALAAITTAFIILQKFGPSSKETIEVPPYRNVVSSNHDQMEQGVGSAATTVNTKKVDSSLKLTFLKDDAERFDLAELLKASAVVLGGGVFGSCYKTTISRQKILVVKRCSQMNNVTQDEFCKHMMKLGKLNHQNVVPLIAFYYRKEEKLLVAHYVENISLAVHLHGSRSQVKRSLDWPTRLKIVKGVARGLLHLYHELPSLIAPHGHLKSSNVLLNREFESLLTDYGLIPITNQEHARDVMIAFKSPEYKNHGRITKKTDVWSLGVLILEIMTGKFPANTFSQSKGGDVELTNFVDSMFKEEMTVDMFDKEIGEFNKHNEGEMLKLLTIGLSCCEPNVEKRWDIKEVVDRIEDVKEKNENDIKNED